MLKTKRNFINYILTWILDPHILADDFPLACKFVLI